MKAVLCDGFGDETVLRVAELDPPDLGTNEVRIRVAAAGVNRADLLQRRGHYPPPPGASPILGLECSGTVMEVGDGVEGFAPGDRVMALLAGGGYAEEVAAPAGCVVHVPESLSDAEAGAFPEVYATAHLNLFMLGGLDDGRIALVHGGSGGVGTAAIQLASAAGARIVVTAGGEERCRRCLEVGADHAVDYRKEDFVAAGREISDGRGVDVVLDCIGADYLDRNLRVLAQDGRLVSIGLMGGVRAEIDLARVLTRRLQVIGSTLRSRSAADKAAILESLLRRFGDGIRSGRLRPVIDSVLPLEQVAEAHRRLARGEVFGKAVLSLR
jgi:putative PIG3 family NAD(P)H quinone oxidoreductase